MEIWEIRFFLWGKKSYNGLGRGAQRQKGKSRREKNAGIANQGQPPLQIHTLELFQAGLTVQNSTILPVYPWFPPLGGNKCVPLSSALRSLLWEWDVDIFPEFWGRVERGVSTEQSVQEPEHSGQVAFPKATVGSARHPCFCLHPSFLVPPLPQERHICFSTLFYTSSYLSTA